MHTTLLDYDTLSKQLGVPKGTLYAMVHQDQIPHIRLGARTVRFDPDEIRAWLDTRRSGPSVEVAQ